MGQEVSLGAVDEDIPQSQYFPYFNTPTLCDKFPLLNRGKIIHFYRDVSKAWWSQNLVKISCFNILEWIWPIWSSIGFKPRPNFCLRTTCWNVVFQFLPLLATMRDQQEGLNFPGIFSQEIFSSTGKPFKSISLLVVFSPGLIGMLELANQES